MPPLSGRKHRLLVAASHTCPLVQSAPHAPQTWRRGQCLTVRDPSKSQSGRNGMTNMATSAGSPIQGTGSPSITHPSSVRPLAHDPPARPYSPQRLFSTKQTNRPSGEDAVPTRPGPTVQRRRLGIELRRLREQAGKTIDEVAKILECSDSKVSRIENGQVSASPRMSATCWSSTGSRRSAARSWSSTPGWPGGRVVGGLQRHARCSPGQAGGRGRPDSRVRGNGGPWPAADRGLHPRADQGGPARRLPGTDRTMGSLPHDPAGPAQAACSPYLHVVIEEWPFAGLWVVPARCGGSSSICWRSGTCPT
jgi:DNA-binding XRE family transcriptional regulator